MTKISQKIPVAAWSLLLSQKQEFLNKHLALVPIISNHQGIMEMLDKILSNATAQDMGLCGYQGTGLED